MIARTMIRRRSSLPPPWHRCPEPPKDFLLYVTALVHNQMGNRTAARAAFGESIVENAAFAYGYAGLAALSGASRQREQAAAEYAQAIEPHYAAPHFLLGRARERQGREAGAYPHYERFVALASAKDPQARSMRLRLELRAKGR